MKKICEYFSRKVKQIAPSCSKSENANIPQDDTHDILLFVRLDDETDSTLEVELSFF